MKKAAAKPSTTYQTWAHTRAGVLPRTPPVVANQLPGSFPEEGESRLVKGATTVTLYSEVVPSRPTSRAPSPVVQNAGSTPERGDVASVSVETTVPAVAAGTVTQASMVPPGDPSPPVRSFNNTGCARFENPEPRKPVADKDGWTTVSRRRRAYSLDSASKRFVQWKEEFENYAFGFLDPAQVLRGCHLIPAFHLGQTNCNQLLPYDCAVARQVKLDSAENSSTQDWTNYYVNIFVDRDMVMRHYGSGVGHQANTQVLALHDDEPPADQGHQVDEEELDDIRNSVELDIQRIDRELMELDERGEDREIDEEFGQAEGIAAMYESDGESDEESSDEEEGEFPDFD
ncbi:hypothetical protein H1R20_g15105, partial [Candolleomyces eurysporus]